MLTKGWEKNNSDLIFLSEAAEKTARKKKFLPWKLKVFEPDISENTEDMKSNIIFRVTFLTAPPNQRLKQMFISK